jgi:hypothetical protein
LANNWVTDAFIDDYGNIYVATASGVSISIDGGNNFKNYLDGPIYNFFVTKTGVIVVASGEGLAFALP